MKARRFLTGAMALTVSISACRASGSPVVDASRSIDPSSAPPSAIATAAIPPSLPIEDLPHVDLADIDATAVCDPEPRQTDIGAGESRVFCPDGLALALSVVRTVTLAPPTRMYLSRPTCAVGSCSDDELSTATVTVWTDAGAYAVRLDARLTVVATPTAASEPVWPLPGPDAIPDVARSSIPGAPDEVAHRDPYPFCGRAEIDEPPQVLGCFRSAVLARRRAEMIARVYGTEGGEILWVYRYAGSGRIIRYSHDQTLGGDGRWVDGWGRSEGAMILGITRLGWDFDPWWGTDQKL